MAAILFAATLGGCAGGNHRTASSKGFGSWFQPKKSKQQPKTLAEWMALPRPSL
jgi:hypothetical protein